MTSRVLFNSYRPAAEDRGGSRSHAERIAEQGWPARALGRGTEQAAAGVLFVPGG